MSLCYNLISTYNTHLLDKADKSIQTAFDRISSKNMNNKKGRVTLMKLIYNHYHVKQPITRFLSGPISLTVHTRDDKTLYIFGETHVKKDICDIQNSMTINKYLTDLFKTTDVFIDFYLEMTLFLTYAPTRTSSFLEDIRRDVIKCISQQSSCELVRMHYMDTRPVKSDNGGDYFYKAWLMHTMVTDYGFMWLVRWKDIFPILLSTDVFKFFKHLILTNKYVLKELTKSYMRTQIVTWFDETLAAYINNVDYDYIQEIIDISNKEDLDDMNDDDKKRTLSLLYIVTGYINGIQVLMMDVYSLARIFKKFAPNLNKPDEPRNIIIYSGNIHSENYRTFLNNNNFTMHNDIRSEGKRNCIDIKSIKQPLFNIT